MSRRPLSAIELASAGIMAGLTVVLIVMATALPVLDVAFKIAATLPVALISTRFRPAAGGATVIAAISVAFGIGGLIPTISVAQYSLIGWVLGALYRRGAGWGSYIAAAIVVDLGITAFKFLMLLVLSESRTLTLEAAKSSFTGYLNALAYLPYTEGFVSGGKNVLEWMLVHWWVWLPIQIFVFTLIRIIVAAWLLRIVLARMTFVDVLDRFEQPEHDESAPVTDTDICPLPMKVDNVSHTYPQADAPALQDISLSVEAGEFIVIAGANGSGKSTLAAILSGAQPSQGRVVTPGALGRGRTGGLAYLSQAADVHVIGTTVIEDVLWGFDLSDPAQAALVRERAHTCLAQVGLGEFSSASTRHLSGGEMQRLALASALMHEPSVIISDETTAMIDPAGRKLMMQIFRSLTEAGVTVIHITHDPSEAAFASRLIRLDHGVKVWDGPVRLDSWDGLNDEDAAEQPHLSAGRFVPKSSQKALWLHNVTHYANEKTPWERQILHDIELIVEPGDSVLITGANGSGKTTLARLMTGLIDPSFGKVALGGKEMWREVGSVSMSHQFARLQLLRPTVGEDILDAVGRSLIEETSHAGSPDNTRASRKQRSRSASAPTSFTEHELDIIHSALGLVGLPPELATRRIDDLSGGQQRRVALAGLIAARPSVLILDEPFAGLDAQSRQLVVQVLSELRSHGMSLVMISHDDDGLHALADRHYTLVDGSFADQAASPLPRVRGQRRPAPTRFPQPLPWASSISRMWAGSKVLSWAVVSTLLLLFPSWTNIGIAGAYLLSASLGAKMPVRALPNLPIVFWAGLGGGLLGASLSGGFAIFMRLIAVMVVILWGTTLLLVTTHTSEFTDAVATFFRPLRRRIASVSSWIHAMSLSVRSVPMLMDQSRAVQDTMTIRLYRHKDLSSGQIFSHFADVTTASLSASSHRASLLGTAINMRGGVPPLYPPRTQLSVSDAACALFTIVIGGAMLAVTFIL